MRILIVHQRAGFQGGAEANVHQVAAAFRARGHAAGLLHGTAGDPRSLDGFLEPFDYHRGFDGGTRRGFGAAMDAARDWGADVVFVHKLDRIDALEALLAAGLPLVRMVHDHDMWCQRSARYFPWNRKICTRRAGYPCALTCGVVRDRRPGGAGVALAWPGRKLRELRLCRRFPIHIVQTDFMKSEMLLHGFADGDIRVLPVAPAQDESFTKSDYRARGILFVGQIVRGKGVDYLLRALAKLGDRDWRAVIAGEGAHRASCERLARGLGLGERVRFAGRLNRNALLAEYRRARVGVVPSVWPEPMGMVGLEFMWAGLPVVGFDAGGISHWLDDGRTGILVPPRDVDGLAAALDRLLGDEALAEAMGRRARNTAEQLYRHDDYIDRLLEILEMATPAVRA